jgi:hypothetical protein
LGNTVQGVRETWTTRHYCNANATSEFAVGSSHDAGSGLVVGENEFDTEVTRRGNHVEIRPSTGDAENAVDS